MMAKMALVCDLTSQKSTTVLANNRKTRTRDFATALKLKSPVASETT
jgi:hypothetical protein